MKRGLFAVAGLAIMLVLATPADAAAATTKATHAQKTMKEKSLGRFSAWRAFAYDEGGQMVCYMVTTKRSGPILDKKRTAPYVMITHRPVEASTDVFSYGAGAMLDTRRGVSLRIGTAASDLFSVRDTAWARDTLTDHKIAKGIMGASIIQIKSFYGKKPVKPMIDIFDVAGAAQAYRAIGKACGLPVGLPARSKIRHAKSSVKKK